MEHQHGFVILTPEEVANTGLPSCFEDMEIPERLRLLGAVLDRKRDFVRRRNGLVAPEEAVTLTTQIEAMTDAQTTLQGYSQQILDQGLDELLGGSSPG